MVLFIHGYKLCKGDPFLYNILQDNHYAKASYIQYIHDNLVVLYS